MPTGSDKPRPPPVVRIHPLARPASSRRADIAIFAHERKHTVPNLCRVVVCKPEPKNGKTARIRDLVRVAIGPGP